MARKVGCHAVACVEFEQLRGVFDRDAVVDARPEHLVGARNHPRSVCLCLGQALLDPGEGLVRQRAGVLHGVAVHHEKAQVVAQRPFVAERRCVARARPRAPKGVVELGERGGRGTRAVGAAGVDIVVSGNRQHWDARVLNACKFGDQVLVTGGLAVEGKVAQAQERIGLLGDHVVYQGVDNGVEVARHDGALDGRPVEKAFGLEQPRRQVVQVGCEHEAHGSRVACRPGARCTHPQPHARRPCHGAAEKPSSGQVRGVLHGGILRTIVGGRQPFHIRTGRWRRLGCFGRILVLGCGDNNQMERICVSVLDGGFLMTVPKTIYRYMRGRLPL